jgi:SAM-dependent methyltransferase
MASKKEKETLGKDLLPGAHHHRAFIGPPGAYDVVAHMQFNLLTLLGLREEHYLLDIGCGSLRGGRLFIVYLLPGRYFGIEPEQWLIEEGIKQELSRDFIALKQPRFSNDRNFACSSFGMEFDFVLAQSIFSHAAPGQIQRCLQEVRKCMKPTSLFAATFMEGEKNYAGSDWVYPDCVTYRLSWLQETAAKAGLTCTPVEWFHPAGQTWVLLARPENQPQTQELATLNKMVLLKEELRNTKERLAALERHPYVRAGKQINRLLRKVRRSK